MLEGAAVPRLKVCGFTTRADLEAAIAAGADAVGFVHYAPSPRSLLASDMARLTPHVPEGIAKVAVLVDARPEATADWCASTGTDWVQLCGAQQAEAWRGFDLPLLRRLPVSEAGLDELEAWSTVAAAFVLDHPASPGGTGLQVDASLARRMAQRAPCLLAGGLDENNVSERIAAVRAHGVDASSRLESRPGHKDKARVQLFVQRALAGLEAISRE